MKRTPINFAAKLAKLNQHWTPGVIAEMNDYQFKLVRVEGEFVWHTHDDTDEAFIVLRGELEIGFVDGKVTVGPGEMYVVLKGVKHITGAARECHVLVIEPRGIVNTGDAGGELTASNDVWI